MFFLISVPHFDPTLVKKTYAIWQISSVGVLFESFLNFWAKFDHTWVKNYAIGQILNEIC